MGELPSTQKPLYIQLRNALSKQNRTLIKITLDSLTLTPLQIPRPTVAEVGWVCAHAIY